MTYAIDMEALCASLKLEFQNKEASYSITDSSTLMDTLNRANVGYTKIALSLDRVQAKCGLI